MATLKQAREVVHELPIKSKIRLLSELEDELLAENVSIAKELEQAHREIKRGETATLEEALKGVKGLGYRYGGNYKENQGSSNKRYS